METRLNDMLTHGSPKKYALECELRFEPSIS